MSALQATSETSISLRPIDDGDFDFLLGLYGSTRVDIANGPWNEEQKQQLIRMQFDSQQTHYQRCFPNARCDLILLADQPIGHIYLDRNDLEYRLIDIAILPQYRRRGIGRQLMKSVMADAAAEQKPVRLRVEPDNPARLLYERLGFSLLADEQVNWHMQWLPAPKAIG